MSYRAPLLDRAARPLDLSLISVLICTAASAQSLFAGGAYANRTAIIPGIAFSRYSYSPSWTPRQPGYRAWPRSGGPPGPCVEIPDLDERGHCGLGSTGIFGSGRPKLLT